MYLGIDIGSSSLKAIILNGDKIEIGSAVLNVEVECRGLYYFVERALSSAGLQRSQIRKIVTTGYGSTVFLGADKEITEVSCLAKGLRHIMPQVRTIINIGGREARIICLDNDGNVKGFVTNEKTVIGIGKFLEEMAAELDCDVPDLEGMSDRGRNGVFLSSLSPETATCEINVQLSNGKTSDDVALGIQQLVARRIAELGSKTPLQAQIAITGGVALNRGLVHCIAKQMDSLIYCPVNPQHIGAFGAALYAVEMDNL